MAGHALAAAEDLDGGGGQARPELLADQFVRDRVMVPLEPDVVVQPDRRLAPVGMDEGLRRQRQHRRTLDRLEEVLTRGAEVAADARVQAGDLLPDGGVQFLEAEEAPVAQPRDDPALDQQDRGLDLGLVAGLVGASGQDGRAVMGGHLGVAAVDLGLVEARADHAGLQVVGHDQRRHRAEGGEGAGVGADPVGQRLAPARLGIGHVRGAHHGDEDLRRTRRAGGRVGDRHLRAGIVDEHPLARGMALAHDRREPPRPAAVVLAEGGIAVAVRVLAAILVPEQREGDPRPLQFAVDRRPVRLGELAPLRRRRRREEQPLQRRLVQPLGQRPGQARHFGTTQIFRHGAAANPDAGPDLSAGTASCVEPQYILDLPHRQPSHLASRPRRNAAR